MRCPQCNAELPEAATYCHSCGSPVRPATFSYLPPGTPAWPTTIPQKPSAIAGASAQTAQQKEKESISSTKPLSSRPKRSARTVLVITALFILVPLVGVGATLGMLWFNGEMPIKTVNASLKGPAPSAKQTPASNASTPTAQAQTNRLPTPSSFQTTTVAAVGVTLKYPKEWVKDVPQSTSDNSIILSFHPQQASGIVLYVERFSSSTSAKLTSTNDVNQAILSAFQGTQGVNNLRPVSPPNPQLTIGGVQWDEQDATFTTNSGLQFHLSTIAVQYKQIYYNILYYAPAVVYNEAMQKYFQPMLNSLQFKS
ncbi:MAG TPA: zinc ribbon domain-containing protein [Ktedonobacteraceae bacterium]